MPIVTAGLLSGTLIVVVAISFATLIFGSSLPAYLGTAMGLALTGSALVTIIIALTSSYPGIIACAQDSPAAILAVVVSTLAVQLDGTPERATFVTVLVTIMLATILTGSTMLALGTARLGRLIRYIPYPVIGGFLAGTGYLLLTGGLSAMTGLSLSAATLAAHFEGTMPLRWLPGLALAIVLVVLTRRVSHPLLLAGALVVALGLFFLVLALTGTSIEQAEELGLLIGRLPDGGAWMMPPPAELLAVDWGVIAGQAPQIMTVIVISVLQMLLYSSGIEIVVGNDLDLNRELRSAGLANVVGGLAGGLPGFHVLSLTVIGHSMRANSRFIGLIAGGVALVALLAGSEFLAIFPTGILGGFLAFVGLSLLVEWIYDAARRLPAAEYAIVIVILVTVALDGMLSGVIVGVIAAGILFLVQYSRQSVVRQSLTTGTMRSTVLRGPEEEAILHEHGAGTLILRLQGYLFFGTANSVLEEVRARLADPAFPPLRTILLDFYRVTDLDTSAALSFRRMKQLAEGHSIPIALSSLQPRTRKVLAELLDEESDTPFIYEFADLDYALEWNERRLLDEHLSVLAQVNYAFEHQFARALGADVAASLARLATCRDIASGDYLVRQGDAGAELYYVESGLLSVQLEMSGGKTVRVRTAMPGSIIGEIGFYQRQQRTASIVAEEPSVVYTLTPEALEQMTREAPQAAAAIHHFLASLLAQRLSETTALLRDTLD